MKFLSFFLQVFTVSITIFIAINCHDEPPRQQPRHRHGSCEIVINEFFVGKKSYLEIAKVCPLDTKRRVSSRSDLRGFAVVVLSVKNLVTNCVYSTKLTDNVLKDPSPSRANSPNVPGSSRRAPSPLPQAGSNFQLNAINFLNLQLVNIERNVDSFILYLLVLNSVEIRRALPCTPGSEITEEGIVKITQLKHDSLVIKNQADLPWDIIKTIPSDTYLTNQYFVPMQDKSLKGLSYSRCKSNRELNNPGNFKFSTKTPEKPNVCGESFPFLLLPAQSFLPPYGPFTGHKLEAQTMKVVVNVLKSLETFQNDVSVMKLEPKKLTAKITNLGLTTVYSILSQHNEGKIDQPVQPRKRMCPVMDLVDDTVKDTIYKTITGFYAQNKVPTIEAIYKEFIPAVKQSQLRLIEEARLANEEIPDTDLFDCGLSTFRKILKLLGYKYGNINLRDSIILSPERIEWRGRYLKRIKENDRTQERVTIWLDETWSDPHAIIKKGWIKRRYNDFAERREFAYNTLKVSRGRRIIIIAAGNQDGFVPGSQLVLKISKKDKSRDYHDNINQNSFTNWFLKLLDILDTLGPKKFLIVMDNASYHTTLACPKSNSNKDVMVKWLYEQKHKGYSVPDGKLERLTNYELKNLIQELKKVIPHHRIDNLAKDRGHEVLRLPPYQPDLNPIELVWKDIKHSLKTSNIDQDLDNHFDRASVLLRTYGSSNWNKHCLHVKNIEDEYVKGDASFQNVLNNNPEVEDLYNLHVLPDDDDGDFEENFGLDDDNDENDLLC